MLTNNYLPFVGGVPISIERLSNALRKLGHEVYVFAPSYGNEKEEPFVIRYRSRKKKLRER
jgi:Starch synthase catalytic domain.